MVRVRQCGGDVVNPLDHIMQITTQRPSETELVAPKRRATYVPVFGYGERVTVDRVISRDPDRDTDPIAGMFIQETGLAYWVHVDGEETVGRFNKTLPSGAKFWRIHKSTEATK